MISDGCGYNHIQAANDFLGVPRQPYESFQAEYAMSTYASGGSYDSAEAWNDFGYVTAPGTYTDSAAAATAMSTGVKTANGVIGYDSRGTVALKHALEYAEEKGLSTGVATSVAWSHATPAGFVAHNLSRDNYSQIAQEMVNGSAIDVIMGCGNPRFDDNGDLKTGGFDYQYVGGQETWDALEAGTAGGAVDANHDGRIDAGDRWALIQTKAEFESYADNQNPPVGRLCGTAQVYGTLQQGRTVGSTSEVYGDPLIATVPSLETMAKAAIHVLNKNKRGFFLMIEGGAVDWASVANQSNRAIEEEIEFDKAVGTVIVWVNTHSSWDETLVIVTSDHECGYLWGPGSNPEWKSIIDNGAGRLPGMAWFSTFHTNSLVPFFARGKGADLFNKEIAGSDMRRSEYIDNTAIGKILTGLFKQK